MNWNNYREWLGTTWINEPTPSVNAPTLVQLSTDSRTIGGGEWFLPLTGENFDGHKFIKAAIERGASGFFYKKTMKQLFPPDLLHLGVAVTDVLEAFQKSARGWLSSLTNVKILSLTGSSGKTTTKEMLGGILRQAGQTLATQASFNNEIGVPKTLALLDSKHKFAAIEMGARHIGNIKFLCEMVQPNVVGVLNVGMAHIGEFGSIENLLSTKLEIFRHSPSDAICVANFDDYRIFHGAKSTGKRVISFGESSSADVAITETNWHTDGSMSLVLSTPCGRIETCLGAAHEAFAINSAAAAAMGLAAGLNPNQISEGLKGFSGIKGRYKIHNKNGAMIIDDTYNANPDSMRAGINTLARAFASQDKILVLGDMLELGDHSEEAHRQIGAYCVQVADPSLLVAVGKSAQFFIDGAKSAGFSDKKTYAFETVDALIDAKMPLSRCGSVVYAKGSNGVRLSRLIEALLA